ncbi:MAG: DUF2764 family protein [Paludibacteraceae bacterium]|nr:DUF2764 family protein [Paludibacteraceae bacterium]
MNYYCYIAGMPDIQIDNAKSIPAQEEILCELKQLLSKGDMALLNILRLKYDNANLLKYLDNRDAELNPLGTLTAQDWNELIEIIDNSDELNPARDGRLLKYILDFYTTIRNEQNEEKIGFREDFLAALYYKYGMECKNKFVADWFEFNLNINNILTALTCRKYGWDIKSAIVGDNVVAETIRNSMTARDFNLKAEIDYFDALVSISETANLLDREHRIDALKWNWLEENTFFSSFSIEKVLSFWLRCELMHRWDNLSMEEGAEIFRQMINDLKKDVKF